MTALPPATSLSHAETDAANAPPVLALDGIGKSFPGVRALDGVALELYPGEVTALVGENGAGKSTIVKILTGIYQPDGGTIRLDGQEVRFPSAADAARAGVTAIHQETVLFDELTVAENIFLGHAPRGPLGLIDWRKMRQEAGAILTRIGASLDPGAKLSDLGIASKHLVAIARALSIDARVVIMDEPTAALSHKEIHELYALVDRLKAEGKAILFISHKFDEIFRIADRWTVFRDGRHVGSGRMRDVTEAQLVQMMVGRAVDQIFPERTPAPGPRVMQVEGLSHPTEFDDVTFDLHEGEILGFYGLVGAGRSELMQCLFGISRPSAGACRIGEVDLAARGAAGAIGQAIGQGIVYVPEDRGKQGAIKGLPIFQNVTLPSLGRTSRSGFLRLAEEFALARTYCERLDLRAASLDQDIANLSGGNQQKVVIAKWLATKPRVIILDEPTKGIDIGSKAAVHAFMAELAAEGLAVIMVSSEIPEIMGMSDRAIVMREGRIAARLDRAEMSPEVLVRAAAGIAADAKAAPLATEEPA
ncbi:sugar ABC transporter ATP-binding protein [Acidimangrovimonas sediminis]|uniref:sugar ABC transporter ATP-binding protein n=1 Tax=Acidimangrovimonas sediminis TaxID=2056283 RepID=UPI000C801633|nr:sugar ABC transporter ATP-binding protein [Acidimangrovimonas sediminis]